MRVKIEIDSATPEEAREFVTAFQRTHGHGLPPQPTKEPVVRVAGIGLGVTTPAMTPKRAAAVLVELRWEE